MDWRASRQARATVVSGAWVAYRRRVSLDLHIYGDPVLRRKAEPLAAVTDDIRALAAEMLVKMHEWEGVGLAAQQVGRALPLCVIELPEDYDKDEQGNRINPGVAMPLVLVNPEIHEPSKKTDQHEEGCLSFPGIRASIPRSVEITLRYMDLDGHHREVKLRDFLARVVQHEVDHLNGVLFIDRMSVAKRFVLDKKLKRMKQETEERLAARSLRE